MLEVINPPEPTGVQLSHLTPSSSLLLFSAHPRHVQREVLLSIGKALQSCHTFHPLSMFLLLKRNQVALSTGASVSEGTF